jgi:hypothetical protein
MPHRITKRCTRPGQKPLLNGFLHLGLGSLRSCPADASTLHTHTELVHLQRKTQTLTWRFLRHDAQPTALNGLRPASPKRPLDLSSPSTRSP